MAYRAPNRLALVFAIAASTAALRAQQTNASISVQATMRTAVVLAASVPTATPATDSLPVGASTTTGFNLSAIAAGFNNPFLGSASISSNISWATSPASVRVLAQETINPSSPLPTGGNAFSTMHEVLLSISSTAPIFADLELRWSESTAGMSSVQTEVDLNDDGSIEFTAGTSAAVQVFPISAPAAQPIAILIRRAIFAADFGAQAEGQLTMDLVPRFDASIGGGCWGGCIVSPQVALDGSTNFRVIDTIVGQSPAGMNILMFGPPAALPTPLPFSVPLGGQACTLDIQPALVIPASTAQTVFVLNTPNFVPLSLRPLTLHAQALGVSPGPFFHSSGVTQLTYR